MSSKAVLNWYHLSLLILSAVFLGCELGELEAGAGPEETHCQGCHQSPPSTGEHYYHMYSQTFRKPITCDECHNTAIKHMHWEYNLNKKPQESLLGFQRLHREEDSLFLIYPRTYLVSYSMCEAEIKNDSMYLAAYDSLGAKVRQIGVLDSLAIKPHVIEVFPIDSSSISTDSDEPLTYLEPLAFNRCDYKIKSYTIYKRRIGPRNILYRVLSDINQLTYNDSLNMVYVYISDTSYIDTLKFQIIAAEESDISQFANAEIEPFLTQLGEEEVLLLDERRELFQLHGDSLYAIYLDSTVDMSNPVFATTTGLHGDGKVDISFKHETHTLYQSDTIQVARNQITNEIEYYNVRSIGAWRPDKQSCWYGGISNGECHRSLRTTTFWYRDIDVSKTLRTFRPESAK